eukprot:6184625-Pleurochrysis_carterae.AAC.5
MHLSSSSKGRLQLPGRCPFTKSSVGRKSTTIVGSLKVNERPLALLTTPGKCMMYDLRVSLRLLPRY